MKLPDEHNNIKTNIEEFDIFLKLLQETAPDDYTPFILLLQKEGKSPLLGTGWKTESLSYTQSIDALKKGHNLGIAATATDPLEIIDIDNPDIFNNGGVKETLTVRSACRDGVHCFYFKDPTRPKLGNKPIPGQGEVRSVWYYVVAPGSYYEPDEEDYEKHPTLKENPEKGRYTIEKSIPPTTIIKEELPKEFLKIIYKEDKEGYNIEEILKGVDKNRNETGMRLTSYLKQSGSNIEKEIESWNKKNTPPLPNREIERLLTKDYHYFFKQNPYEYKVENGELKRIPQNQKYIDKKKSQEEYEKYLKFELGWYTNKKGKQIWSFKSKTYAEEIESDHKIICFEENEEIRIYEDGYYKIGIPRIQEKTQLLLLDKTTKHRVNETISYLRYANFIKTDLLKKYKHLISLQNGIFNLDTWKFEKHTPDNIIISQLPVKYDENAVCPKFLKFIDEISDPRDIPVTQEMYGFCLINDYNFEIAFIILGPGSNAKSRLTTILTRLLGEENVSGIPLQDFGYNRFATAGLFGKKANICNELSSLKIKNTGAFKGVCGGDFVKAERKGQDPFEFKNVAKLIFCCNKLPETDDKTPAFFRRWITITPPNYFDPNDPKTDPNIVDKICTPEEMSGIFNWALEGLKRILDNKGFSDHQSVDDKQRNWELRSDPVASFFDDCMIIETEGEVGKEEAYQKYVEYCKENQLPKETYISFTRNKVKDLGLNLIVCKLGSKKHRVPSWRGVRIRLPFEEKDVDFDEDFEEKDDGVRDKNDGVRDKTPQNKLSRTQNKSSKTRSDKTGGKTVTKKDSVRDVQDDFKTLQVRKKGEKQQISNNINNITTNSKVSRTSQTQTQTPSVFNGLFNNKTPQIPQFERNKNILKIIIYLTTDTKPVHFENICDRTEIKGISIEETKTGMSQLEDANHIFSSKKHYWFAITKLSEFKEG